MFFSVQPLDQCHHLIYTAHQQALGDVSTSQAIARMPGPFTGPRRYSTYAASFLRLQGKGVWFLVLGTLWYLQNQLNPFWVLVDWVPKMLGT